MPKCVKTTFKSEDITILCKDVTDIVEENPVESRELKKAQGQPYYYDLPKEYVPTDVYMEIIHKQLKQSAVSLAGYVCILVSKLQRSNNLKKCVLVSILRSGAPTGVLLKRAIQDKCEVDVPHYGISVIREVGIDKVALRWICDKHPDCKLIFVDGWVGKGVITQELKQSLNSIQWFKHKWDIAVISDPTHQVMAATNRDIFIPTACLNSTVCGLVSRTVYNPEFIDPDKDFHGAKYYKEFEGLDETNKILDFVQNKWKTDLNKCLTEANCQDIRLKDKQTGGAHTSDPLCNFIENAQFLFDLADKYDVVDTQFMKPGIGETTRVLLRRVPKMVLYNKSMTPKGFEKYAPHIVQLCRDKGVPLVSENTGNYLCIGIADSMNG